MALSRDVRRPLYEIEGLISFYPHFRTEPPAKVALHVCHDLSCWLRGARGAARRAARSATAQDADVELVEVSCLGRCDVAPAAAVNERPAAVSRCGRSASRRPGRPRWTTAAAARPGAEPWPNDPYPAGSGVAERYASLRGAARRRRSTRTSVIATLKDSGLRGMGGAGFPTGQKWDLVRGTEPTPSSTRSATPTSPSPARSRTGRSWPTSRTWCSRACCSAWPSVGAEQGWVFIRHEYGPEERSSGAEIEALRDAGLIGPDACGSGRRLDVEVFVSPGGYILGEETALLECMEGHRGEPRNKPPFPGNYGLHGRPTLINSVETFADVPVIAAARRRLVEGAGRRRLGRLEVLRRLRARRAARRLLRADGHHGPANCSSWPAGSAAAPASARSSRAVRRPTSSAPTSSTCRLDFGTLAEAGTMLGSGAMVVIAEGTDLLAASTNVLRFFRDESCGKCVPCRVGSTKAHALLRETLDAGRPLDDGAAGARSSGWRRRCARPRSAGSARSRSARWSPCSASTRAAPPPASSHGPTCHGAPDR